MDCKKIRDALLTDYLDGQGGAQERARVNKHLELCAACRSFQEELRLAAVEPFKNSAQPEVPEALWHTIKERITERQSRKVDLAISLWDLVRGKLKVFSLPRPALAFASAMAIVLIMAGAITKYQADKSQVQEYLAQQIEFYAMLNNGEENGFGASTQDSGVSFERYIF